MTSSISVPAAELRRAMTAVLPHVSADDTLPSLTCVKLETRDGWLYLAATDRYSMGVARVAVPGGCEDQDAMLPAGSAHALRQMLERAGSATVALAIGPGSLAAAHGQYDSATWATMRDGAFPGWRGMLGRIVSAEQSTLADSHGLNGGKLARFVLPEFSGDYMPLRMFVTSASGVNTGDRTVVFMRGDWFLGVLMPVLSQESAATAASAWIAMLAPPGLAAGPELVSPQPEAVPANA